MNWELLWKIVFIGIVILFGAMSVLVTVFGAKDIKQLIAHLKQAEDQRE